MTLHDLNRMVEQEIEFRGLEQKELVAIHLGSVYGEQPEACIHIDPEAWERLQLLPTKTSVLDSGNRHLTTRVGECLSFVTVMRT